MSGAGATEGVKTLGREPASPWAPLRAPVFRTLLVATTVSNLGGWMQDVGRALLMTRLTPSPLYVALVQTAAMSAILVFSVPAGALADRSDKRRVLLAAQAWMMAMAGLLAAATWFGAMTPALLLALTFGSAVGIAFTGPVWQAALPELVGPGQLAAATILNGLSFNLTRAAGPALGGAVVAAAGPVAVFALNAVSFGGVIAALLLWRRPPEPVSTMPEPFGPALRAGLRYARQPSPLRNVLTRTALFALPASALWALLPVVARSPGAGTASYGVLLALIGGGAVATALAFPILRRNASDATLMPIASAAMAAGLASASAQDPDWIAAAMVAAGGGWLTALTILTVACQAATPDWVRGRALSIFLLAFSAAMASGSFAWGALAEVAGPGTALLAAAGAQLLTAGVSSAWALPAPGNADAASQPRAWPAPEVAGEPHPSAGPVRVTVEYVVDPSRVDDFLSAMAQLGHRRRAEGSVDWALHRSAADPSRYVETNDLASWGDHLRQRERGSEADAELERVVTASLSSGPPPRVSHWFGEISRRERAPTRPVFLNHIVLRI